jgi:hypothetical protein
MQKLLLFIKWPSLPKSVSKFTAKQFNEIDPLLQNLSSGKHSSLFSG